MQPDPLVLLCNFRFHQPSLQIAERLEHVLLSFNNPPTPLASTFIAESLNVYAKDFDIEKLSSELILLPTIIKQASIAKTTAITIADLQQLLRSVPKTSLDFIPQYVKLLKLFLCLPFSTATAERTFSALRRLKSWMRSTMTQKRLCAFAICNIHKEVTRALSPIPLCKQFAERTQERAHVFGHFA